MIVVARPITSADRTLEAALRRHLASGSCPRYLRDAARVWLERLGK